ncbi:hypothetical protein ACROYT_G019942 [Oculina patagonica]
MASGVGESLTQIKELTVWKISLVFGYYFAILLSLVGNAVVIKAVRRIGRALRRKVHYLFIVNLSVADLLFALEMTPMICVHMLLDSAWLIQGRLGNFLCKFDVFLSAVLILISNLTILAIAVEKFLGIFFPLRTFVSKKRAYFIMASTWLVSGLYCAPLFYFAYLVKGTEDGKFTCFVCMGCEKVARWFLFQTVLLAAGFIITLALYSAISIKIWLRKTPGIQLYEVQRKGQAKKHKALKMLTMLVFVFYVSFIPFWISQLSLHFSFYEKLGSYYSIISAFLMLCNGAVNPVIYSVYNMDIRREFISLFTCKSPSSATTYKPSPSKRGNNQTKATSTEKNLVVIHNNNLFEDSRL